MVYGRMSIWKYKPGKREEGLKTIDELIASTARTTKGFRGAITLSSANDTDAAVIITLWDTEDDLESSGKGVFQETINKIKPLLASAPEIKNYKEVSAELNI